MIARDEIEVLLIGRTASEGADAIAARLATTEAASDATTLAAWISNSLIDSDGNSGAPLGQTVSGLGYLEGAHQSALLLRGSEFWRLVAVELIERGIIDPSKHGRYAAGLGASA